MREDELDKQYWQNQLRKVERELGRELTTPERQPQGDGAFNHEQRMVFRTIYPRSSIAACQYLSALIGRVAVTEYNALMTELDLW